MARPDCHDLTREQLIQLLQARDRKKFGLVWERDAIEHDRAWRHTMWLERNSIAC